MCIYGIGLEVVRKSPEKELIDDTVADQDRYAIAVLGTSSPALLYGQIVLNLTVSPICKVLWIIVYRVESIAAHQCDSIREYCPRDGESWCDSDAGHHRNFGALRDHPRIHFYMVRVLVSDNILVSCAREQTGKQALQISELFRNRRV